MPYQADCDSAGGLREGAFQPLLCGEARKLASGKLGVICVNKRAES
jgi:hypothetical protein